MHTALSRHWTRSSPLVLGARLLGVSLSVLAAACSSGAAPPSSALADAGAGEGASEVGPATEDGGTTTDPASSPSAPVFLSFSTDATTITEGGSVTFVAVLTDPNGLDDIAGGTLKSPAGDVTYGGFGSGSQKGSFTLEVTWDKIHKSKPIEFVKQGTRDFVAEFFDAAGNRATRPLTLTFDCSTKGGSACAGKCTDVTSSKTDCGRCGRACTVGRCMESACVYDGASKTSSDCNSQCAAFATPAMPLKCESTCAFTAGTTGIQSLTGTSAVAAQYCSSLSATGACINPPPAIAAPDCSTVPPATVVKPNATYPFGWKACCCVAR